ncbi:unnamed protein product [Diabrotica balteata]|uniref:Uncharacterized protein n=1 Tax=Diabrotica balteata TaxID=107213 RepID=A0A9N9XD50_DIABA|nr:unnamed protein product [Diabrotica balteata]
MSSCGGLSENFLLNMEFEDTSEKVKAITRRELYDILREFKGNKIDEKFTLLEDRLAQMTSCPREERNMLSRSLKYFNASFKQKWAAARNTDERFLKHNEEWLKTSLELLSWSSLKPGRPVKQFHELSERSKRRRTEEIRACVPVEELIFAERVSQGTFGNKHASKMIKEITSTPTKAKKIRKIISSKKDHVEMKYTPQEVLSLFVEGNFTRNQWTLLQIERKYIYPCYSLLQKVNKECYPDEDKITVTETIFNVELKALLDHTALRFIQYLKEVLDTLNDTEKQHLLLISKWGCDGSHQTQFKQKFKNVADDDSNIFMSSIVPVRLVVSIDGKAIKIIWQNPTPSSVRFYRPIRALFVHETKVVTKEEIEYIENQAKYLIETKDSATSVKISDNFADNGGRKAYKEPIKKWQARTPEDKKIIKETKEKVQKCFRAEMGLLVDIPKAGYGNSNDGNTSRRFFQNTECSSRITGLNRELINRFKVILEVLLSGHEIDHQKFENYAPDTAQLYVQVIQVQVIQQAILPIRQLSEEAAEARNKHFRKYRVDFSRKFSRIDCNRDVLNRLLLTSDPLISCSRLKNKQKILPFSDEAKAILITATPNPNSLDDNTVEDDDDEEDSDIIIESDYTDSE